MAEAGIMSDIEFGRRVMGYQPGQTIEGAELDRFEREYAKYREKALTDWRVRDDPATGRRVRENPTTGLTMDMTNATGQVMGMAGTGGGSQDVYGDYMNPGVAGADVATNGMTNSMAFNGVQPAAAPAGNPVVPVNVNPAMQRTAGPAVPTGVTAAAPVFQTEDDVISAARAGQLSKEQAQQILVNQFGLDP
jgi:hypothetical protein